MERLAQRAVSNSEICPRRVPRNLVAGGDRGGGQEREEVVVCFDGRDGAEEREGRERQIPGCAHGARGGGAEGGREGRDRWQTQRARLLDVVAGLCELLSEQRGEGGGTHCCGCFFVQCGEGSPDY